MSVPEEDYADDYYDAASAAEASNASAEEKKQETSSRKSGSKVVPINSANTQPVNQYQIILVKPDRFDDAGPIADHLCNKHAVLLNLESAKADVCRRLLDFLSGVAYANNGQLKRTGERSYIIAPFNVDIMGDLVEELENGGTGGMFY